MIQDLHPRTGTSTTDCLASLLAVSQSQEVPIKVYMNCITTRCSFL